MVSIFSDDPRRSRSGEAHRSAHRKSGTMGVRVPLPSPPASSRAAFNRGRAHFAAEKLTQCREDDTAQQVVLFRAEPRELASSASWWTPSQSALRISRVWSGAAYVTSRDFSKVTRRVETTLDIHLGDGQFQRPFTADALLQRRRVELHAAGLRHLHSERSETSLERLRFKPIGVPAAGARCARKAPPRIAWDRSMRIASLSMIRTTSAIWDRPDSQSS